MIIIKNRKLLIPEDERYIGTTADSNSEVLTFRIDRYTQTEMDLSTFTVKADIYRYETEETDRADLEMEVQDNYILLYLYITSGMVAYPGTILIDIKAFNDDGVVKWSSYKGAFFVEDPFVTPQATQANLTELEQLEARINRAIATANEKAIEVAKNWLDENIHEIEGYVIDKSLSVENAAADARTVGERLAARIPYDKVQTPIKAQLTKIFDGPHQDYIHQGFAYDGEYYYFARYKTSADPVILSKINATTGEETSVTTPYVCHANAISIIDDKLYITGNDNNLLMVYDKNLNFVKEIQTPDSVYAFDRSTSNTNVCIYGISATESFAVCVLTDGKLQVVGGVTGSRIPATNKQGIFVGSYIYQLLSRYGKNPGHIRIITMFGIEYGDIVFDFDDTGIEFEDLTKINNYFWISDSKGNVYKTDDLTGKLSHLFTLSPFTPPNFGMNYSPVATKITPSNGLCNATFYTSGSNYVLKSFVIPNQVINRTCFAPRVIFETNANRAADGYIDVQQDKRLTVTLTYLASNSLVIINARYLYDTATNTFTFDESYFRAIVKDLVNASSTPTVYTDINAFVGAGNSLTVRSFAAQSLYYHNIEIQTL